MTALLILMFLLLLPITARASNGVCGNDVRPQCAGTVGMTNYHTSMDPAQISALGCFPIPPEPHTISEAQDALIRNTANSHPWGRCHLKVVNGLAAVMTQAEKDVVNTAMQAVKDEQDAQAAAAADPQCSQATQAQIDAFFQKKWDDTEPPTNTNDFKGDIDKLTTNTAAAIRTTLTDITQRMLGVVKQVAKCNRAMGG